MIVVRICQHILHIIPDAVSCEFEKSLLACPEEQELHRGIGGGVDLRLFVVVHREADQRGGDLAEGLHIRSHGLVAEGAQGDVAGMAEVEMDVGMPDDGWLPFFRLVKNGFLGDAVLF